MILALDYDGTYTKDPSLWQAIIPVFRAAGHEVFCCTMRTPAEVHSMDPALLQVVQVIPTSRKAKGPFLEALGIPVDVWIDDNPLFILSDSADCPQVSIPSVKTALLQTPKAKARMTLSKPLKEASNA